MKFIDFCAGIGGGRLGLENNGFNCVAFSEIDNNAEITYRKIFEADCEVNFGNLMDINIDSLPEFDLLIGGFPCQTFSIIGDRCGLNDYDRGQIIYGIAKIIKEKNLKYFVLENVKGLTNHDQGHTFKTILDLLTNLGYKIEYKVLNSLNFGVPQMRERIYIVGIRKDLVKDNEDFQFPTGNQYEYNIEDFLCDNEDLYIDENSRNYETFLRYLNNKYNKDKYSLEELLKQEYLILDTRQSDLRLYENKIPTIRKGRQGILYVKNGKLRKLSGYESLLLQGFPKEHALKVKGKISNSNLLGQAGNAMTVNVITAIAKKLTKYISKGLILTNEELVKRGSLTAINGFKNEDYVVAEFNNWKRSVLSPEWLKAMNYNLEEIDTVKAVKVNGSYKADIQVEIKIEIKLKHLTDIQNIQVKLVSNPSGFNQIDKRWLKSYKDMWDIPADIYELLRHFTGEIKPKVQNPRDIRRMFIEEFTPIEQQKLLDFFTKNKTLIVSDILKGRGKFAAEWMLVILNKEDSEIEWVLKAINIVMNFFGNGAVEISPRGSIKIGKITIQRKGGDNGRDSANMLQFKINPTELFQIK